MALPAHIIALFRSADAPAARTVLGAGTSSVALPATATAAELRTASQAGTRTVSPLLLAPLFGTTAARPTDCAVGSHYFDTTLGKPVFLKTAPSVWVDGTGTTV